MISQQYILLYIIIYVLGSMIVHPDIQHLPLYIQPQNFFKLENIFKKIVQQMFLNYGSLGERQFLSNLQNYQESIKQDQFSITNRDYIQRYHQGLQGNRVLDFSDSILIPLFQYKIQMSDFGLGRFENFRQNIYPDLRSKLYSYFIHYWEKELSTKFHHYISKKATFDEIKANISLSFIENFKSIFNLIIRQLDKHIQAKYIDQMAIIVTKDLDQIFDQILKKLSKKYPQSTSANPTQKMNKSVAKLIDSIDISPRTYFLFQHKVAFQENKDYSTFIETCIQTVLDQTKAKFFIFNQWMKALLGYSRQSNDQKVINQLSYLIYNQAILDNEFEAKNIIRRKKMDQTHDAILKINKLTQKSAKYFSQKCIVGTKINLDQQIQQNKLDQQSLQRLLAKWKCQLTRFLNNPQEQVNKQYFFKNFDNKSIELSSSQKKYLCQMLKNQNKAFYLQLEQMKRYHQLIKCHFMYNSEQRRKGYASLKYTSTRQASSQINFTAKKMLMREISLVIHHLILAGRQMNVNLIYFNVNDIMRAKIQCNEAIFINICQTLQMLNILSNEKIKVRRIKNKLKTDSKNMLINFDFLGVPSQIQIQLQSKNVKDRFNYDFSHFIYELTRSSFGITTECAKMVCKYDKIIAASPQKIYKDQWPSRVRRFQKNKNINSSFFSQVYKKNEFLYICINCDEIIFNQKNENLQQYQQHKQMCNQCINQKLQDNFQELIPLKNEDQSFFFINEPIQVLLLQDSEPLNFQENIINEIEIQQNDEIQSELIFIYPKQTSHMYKGSSYEAQAIERKINQKDIALKYPQPFQKLAFQNAYALISQLSSEHHSYQFVAKHQLRASTSKNQQQFIFKVQKGDNQFISEGDKWKFEEEQMKLSNMSTSGMKLWIQCTARAIAQLQQRKIYQADLAIRNTIFIKSINIQIFKMIDFDKAFKFTKTKQKDKSYECTYEILKSWFSGDYSEQDLRHIFNISQETAKNLYQTKKSTSQIDILAMLKILQKEAKKSHLVQFTKIIRSLFKTHRKYFNENIVKQIEDKIQLLMQQQDFEKFADSIRVIENQ